MNKKNEIGQETRDRVWTTMVRLNEFTYRDVSGACGIEERRVGVLAREWTDDGRLERIEPDGALRARCRIVQPDPEPVVEPQPEEAGFRRAQTRHGNMWAVMRRFRAFSPTDIAAIATTDEITIDQAEALKYCRLLVDAGYLRTVQRQKRDRREPRFQLIRDTGPQPPSERRVRAVWDPNTGDFAVVSKVAS